MLTISMLPWSLPQPIEDAMIAPAIVFPSRHEAASCFSVTS